MANAYIAKEYFSVPIVNNTGKQPKTPRLTDEAREDVITVDTGFAPRRVRPHYKLSILSSRPTFRSFLATSNINHSG